MFGAAAKMKFCTRLFTIIGMILFTQPLISSNELPNALPSVWVSNQSRDFEIMAGASLFGIVDSGHSNECVTVDGIRIEAFSGACYLGEPEIKLIRTASFVAQEGTNLRIKSSTVLYTLLDHFTDPTTIGSVNVMPLDMLTPTTGNSVLTSPSSKCFTISCASNDCPITEAVTITDTSAFHDSQTPGSCP